MDKRIVAFWWCFLALTLGLSVEACTLTVPSNSDDDADDADDADDEMRSRGGNSSSESPELGGVGGHGGESAPLTNTAGGASAHAGNPGTVEEPEVAEPGISEPEPSSTPTCEEGETDCDGSTPRVCEAGVWRSKAECSGLTPVCHRATGTCRCAVGGAACDGDTPRVCVNGAWELQEPCGGTHPICDPASGSCFCEEDAFICDDVRLLQCVHGSWDSVTLCLTESPVCNAEEARCDCLEGAARCDRETPVWCVSGQWEAQAPCMDPYVCDLQTAECTCALPINDRTGWVDHPAYGCGSVWDFEEDPKGAWTSFQLGIHYDAETRKGWYAIDQELSRAEFVARCETLSVAEVAGWHLATIDDQRSLAAGCSNTAVGGACPISGSCDSNTCYQDVACDTCDGADFVSYEGPGTNGSYCRPNVPLCSAPLGHTSTPPGEENASYFYNPVYGSIGNLEASRPRSYCVRDNLPGF